MDVNKDVEKIRADFPVLRNRAFLDTACFCPYSIPVANSIKEFLEFLSRPATNLQEMFRVFGEEASALKRKTAAFINAKEEEIALTTRTTSGMCIVANGLEWKKGDNVVTTDQTHPCCTVTYMGLPGVKIKRVKNVDGAYPLSAFEEVVDKNTKMISITSTEWVTGWTHDLQDIRKLADEYGAYLMVDAAQSLGQLEIDVKKTGVDFFTSGFYKWMTGPLDGAIFYVREDLIEKLKPTFRTVYQLEYPITEGGKGLDMFRMVGNQNPASDSIYSFENRGYAKTAARFEIPSIHTDIWGMNTAIDYIMKLGIGNIRKRIIKLSNYLTEGLVNIGCKLNTPIETEERYKSGLHNYTTGSYETDHRSFRNLNSFGVNVSLRYSGAEKGWKEGMYHIGGIRVSTHFFNTEEDIDKLLMLQKKLLS